MKFEEYSDRAYNLALPSAQNLWYMTLGLVGESGEVANKVKKAIRDHEGTLSAERRLALVSEVGDVLWYVNGLARLLGYSLEEVALANLEKLEDRDERGVLGGDGDKR